ncbi:MAG: PilZ domain-containing protein [Gammaproteobacteria bacterium]|nr:PilZ domain-containing protein [Gammaproteobacteria bacterium]
MQDNTTIRKYIRHPADIPIQVLPDRVVDEDDGDTTLTSISLGGLSFISPRALDVLRKVRICIPMVREDNYLEGRVVWCEKSKSGYEVGLQFDRSSEVFRLRMIEQICHIEHYRREVEQREGRQLSPEEAANEWIALYAGDFPEL